MEENILKEKLGKIKGEYYCYFTLIVIALIVFYLFISGIIDAGLRVMPIEYLCVIEATFVLMSMVFGIVCFIEMGTGIENNIENGNNNWNLLYCCIIICLICLCCAVYCNDIMVSRDYGNDVVQSLDKNCVYGEDAVIVDNEVVVNNNGVTVKQYTHITINYG